MPTGEFAWSKQAGRLPLCVEPGGSNTIVVRLKDDNAKTLARADTVEFSYEFTITGGKDASNDRKKNTKHTTIRLRKHGPAYLK